MRILFLLSVCICLSGCFQSPTFGHVGDKDCRPQDPVEDGFRLVLNQSTTTEDLEPVEGYCVHVIVDDDWSDGSKSALNADGVAWVAVDAPATYRFFVVIPWERDPLCGAWYEANATQHTETGVVELELDANEAVCS